MKYAPGMWPSAYAFGPFSGSIRSWRVSITIQFGSSRWRASSSLVTSMSAFKSRLLDLFLLLHLHRHHPGDDDHRDAGPLERGQRLAPDQHAEEHPEHDGGIGIRTHHKRVAGAIGARHRH